MAESAAGENGMSMRTQLLRTALTWVRADSSVDIVGRRFAGRTHFLRELVAELENDSWRVLWISGNSFIQSAGLAALDLAGLMEAPLRGRSSLRLALDSVLERADARRFVVVVDDWDALDEASWGVLLTAQQRAGFPIVRSTLRRRARVSSPAAVPSLPRGSKAYLVDLQPMRIDELDKVLAARLGGPLDFPTLARVLGTSGGVVGLAISIVDSARAEGTLRQNDGVWTATAGLWTPALTRIVEAYLSDVTGPEWDALQLLAMVGEIDPASASEVLGWGALESLEDRALVQIHAIGSRRLIAVVPPLVTEFFRRGAQHARRARLADLLTRFPGVAEVDEAFDDASARREPDGLFVRAVGERIRMERHVARREWLKAPTCATAVRYVQALNADHADVQEIVAVLGRSDLDGDPASRARLRVLRAWWTANFDGDVDGALAALEQSREGLGVFGRLLDAAKVDLLVNFRDAPDDPQEMLRIDVRLPREVGDGLRESQLAAYVSGGRLDSARALLTELPRDAEGGYPAGFLAGIVALFGGDPAGARRAAYESIQTAREALDARALRWFAYLGALAELLAGRYTAARSLVDLALSLGRPPLMAEGVHGAILSIGELLAQRREDEESAAVMASQRGAFRADAGILPFDMWPSAQRSVNAGDDRSAAALLWKSGNRHWNRGARMRGMLDMLGALELAPARDRLKDVRMHADRLDSPLFVAQVEFLLAASTHDESALLKAVPALSSSGTPGRAYTALTVVQKLRSGNPDELDADLLALAADLGLSSALSDVFSFGRSAPRLSRRESEIAQLAASGVSNQGIADRFTISTRTVENHIHRILRKTGLDRRDALRDYMLAGKLWSAHDERADGSRDGALSTGRRGARPVVRGADPGARRWP